MLVAWLASTPMEPSSRSSHPSVRATTLRSRQPTWKNNTWCPRRRRSGGAREFVEHSCGQQNGPRQFGMTSARDSNGAVEHLRACGFEGHDLDAVARHLGAAAG